ncbi:MAG: phosphatidate cytidylyltransferase [Bacilli bacterium]|nr:phosphatidate cytidylyltransferase [Bacilli bacterium]
MKQRIISAIIALIIFIPLVILGGIYFKIGLTIISLLAIKEVLSLKDNVPFLIKILSYIIVGILVFVDINIVLKLLIPMFIYLILAIFIDDKKYNIEDTFFLSGFSMLIIVFFSYMYLIRQRDINVLIYLFLITILTDTFAYIGGRIFGKHKLIESVSPNKTIEGSIIGSIIGTILPSAFYLYIISPGEYFTIIVLFTLALSLIGQIGDLAFSKIKRFYRIKDFSNIMPGHGGILDRFDSIIFVIIGYIILINFM